MVLGSGCDRKGEDLGCPVRVLTTDVFGQPVKPLARCLEEDEPLVCLLDKALPPVRACDRADDLCTGGEPCLDRGSRDLQRELPRIRCRMDLQVLAFGPLPHIPRMPARGHPPSPPRPLPPPPPAKGPRPPPAVPAAADGATWSAGTDVTSHRRAPCA